MAIKVRQLTRLILLHRTQDGDVAERRAEDLKWEYLNL